MLKVQVPIQMTCPEISWNQIVGMRNRIVHDYMNIDADIVWEVVTCNIPTLTALLEPLSDPPAAE